jgi:hypothetical protein
MTAILGALLGLALAAVVLVVVKTTGQNHLARHLATVGGAVCLVLFVMINVSDWPAGFLNQFWLDHAIVGATAGSLLLAATVFLIYRYRDQQQQDLVDESIVDAGRTELVDRLVEVDVALSLLCAPVQPELCQTSDWQKTTHGLEWLREHLDQAGVAVDGSWAELDPRFQGHGQHVHAEEWRLPLLDQMIRRVAGGVRDWGPILMRSRAGQRDLVAFANVRLVLLHLDRLLRQDVPMDTSVARDLQRVVRRFAHLLEVDEQTPEPRTRLVVPSLEQKLVLSPTTANDPTAVELLERIEGHIRSRVRRGKRWTRPHPGEEVSSVQAEEKHAPAAPLDVDGERVPS